MKPHFGMTCAPATTHLNPAAIFLLAVVLSLWAQPAAAGTRVWTGRHSTLFSDPGNWADQTVPMAGDTVVHGDAAGFATLRVDVSVALDRVEVTGGGGRGMIVESGVTLHVLRDFHNTRSDQDYSVTLEAMADLKVIHGVTNVSVVRVPEPLATARSPRPSGGEEPSAAEAGSPRTDTGAKVPTSDTASVTGDGVFFINRPGGRRIRAVRVARSGDPAPGIPGAFFGIVVAPHMRADGSAMLITTIFGAASGEALWTWSEEAGAELIVRAGDQAPDLPARVVFTDFSFTNMSDNGIVVFRSDLAGPGIIPGVNDAGVWKGPPGDLRLIAQKGDPAPGMIAGTTFGNSLFTYVGVSGRAAIATSINIPGWPDFANGLWLSEGGPLEKIVATTDPTGWLIPGSIVRSAGFQQPTLDSVVFRISLFDGEDERGGSWRYTGGQLDVYTHDDFPAPDQPEGVFIESSGVAMANSTDQVSLWGFLRGDGIDSDNDTLIWCGGVSDLTSAVQESDQVSGLAAGVVFTELTADQLSSSDKVYFRGRYAGPGVDATNDRGIHFGDHMDPMLILRAGDPGPDTEETARVLLQNGGTPSIAAQNGVGDLVIRAYVIGTTVDETNNDVVWFHDHVNQQWHLVVRDGETWDDEVVGPDGIHCCSVFGVSGGSDARRKGLADTGAMGVRIDLPSGVRGSYVAQVIFAGDFDADGTINLTDFEQFQACFTGPGSTMGLDCHPGDFDDDDDIDFADFAGFQRTLGSSP